MKEQSTNPVPASVQDGRGLPNPYSGSERLRRLAWSIVSLVAFRTVPHQVAGWHAFVLRMFGATVGSGCIIYGTTRIAMPWNITLGDCVVLGREVELYSLGRIEIGSHTVISQKAVMCAGTHDYRDPAMPLLRSPIRIGTGAWICAEAFVGPGVAIGDGAVVGARSVVVRDLPAMMVCAGNPCVPIKQRNLRPAND